MDTDAVCGNGLLMYDSGSGMHVVQTETGWFRLSQTSAESDVGLCFLAANIEANQRRLQAAHREATAVYCGETAL